MSQDLDENYKAAYGKKAGFGKRPALVLIDFAQAYFDPECPLYAGVDDALASALRIRKLAHEIGIPVVLTEVTYHRSGINGGRFMEKAKPLGAFIKGRSTAEFAKGLVPLEDEIVVSKQYPSAFFGTSLASTLTAMGIDNVVLTGLTTSGCVRASCVDSMSHGFITTVVSDACGDRHQAPHDANLFDMNAKYADVVSEDEIVQFFETIRR
ncbi:MULTISPECIES: isochorismatase family protein [Agrobacterium]|uniref:Isochorismatase n=1 Tax=Agrobacterium rosae TaxID=1972867 RepID=A0A1R3TXQ2_9HYPH|nr:MULTISPECIES: isochorismatase family protein [Agrobacterium]KAA3511634.1 isochorismatase family protein [Agrobacterium rosae]KAA3518942.1 isochorismatase family protein [Agrobacterium rosae]MBN7806769.1 isochorismatase family protein [Agrobacterium rosae]MCM2435187.1 isochorismatase family protein [Agrobacterium rosae]MDX8314175.1 isochorismatase family protein [Agrobacterium rosae]